jgi:hypothetical protein
MRCDKCSDEMGYPFSSTYDIMSKLAKSRVFPFPDKITPELGASS